MKRFVALFLSVVLFFTLPLSVLATELPPLSSPAVPSSPISLQYSSHRDEDGFFEANGEFYFSPTLSPDTGIDTFFYSDRYFLSSSYQYQDSLSTMSLHLAMSAFPTLRMKGYENSSLNLRELLKKCGFPDQNFSVNAAYCTRPTESSIGVGASWKPLHTAEGDFTLLAVGIRGAQYYSEWAGNFTVGDSGFHSGFLTARDEVFSFLRDYIKAQDIHGSIKLWITGFSRGAATANLVAGLLDDGALDASGVTLLPQDLYAYTFGTPKGASMVGSTPLDSKYYNIFNIVNPADVVPRVAPTAPQETFGFYRYGVTLFLPSPVLSTEYPALRDAMLPFWNSYRLSPYAIDDFQTKRLYVLQDIWGLLTVINTGALEDNPSTQIEQSLFVTQLMRHIFHDTELTRDGYVTNYQDSVRSLLNVILGADADRMNEFFTLMMQYLQNDSSQLLSLLFQSNFQTMLDKLESYITDILTTMELSNRTTQERQKAIYDLLELGLAFYIENPEQTYTFTCNSNRISQAHNPELYCAWLKSFDPLYGSATGGQFNQGEYLQLSLPVSDFSSLSLCNTEGTPLSTYIDGTVTLSPDSGLSAALSDNAVLTLYLPLASSYTVQLSSSVTQPPIVTLEVFSLFYEQVTFSVQWQPDDFHFTLPANTVF